jgi:hypothetical protein
MVLLTIVAVLPFAVPLIAVAAIAVILAGAWLGDRAAGRGSRWLGRGPRRPGVRRGQADLPNRNAPRGALGDTGATGPSV